LAAVARLQHHLLGPELLQSLLGHALLEGDLHLLEDGLVEGVDTLGGLLGLQPRRETREGV